MIDQREWDGANSCMYAEDEKWIQSLGGKTCSEEAGHLEDLGADEEIILKTDFQEINGACGLDSYGSG